METISGYVNDGHRGFSLWVKRAGELSAKARKRWSQANTEKNHVKVFLVVLSMLLAIPTGFALAYLFSWPFGAGYLLALVMHLLLGASVHYLVLGKRTGNRDRYVAGVIGTGLLVIGFLLAAYSRQKMLTEGGLDPILSWLAAFVFWLLEISGPVLLGYEHALKTDVESDARNDRVFFDEHYGLIDVAGDDAPGSWDDQVNNLVDRLDRMPGPSARSLKDEREVQSLQRWLDALCIYHPYKRYGRVSDHKIEAIPTRADDQAGNGKHFLTTNR